MTRREITTIRPSDIAVPDRAGPGPSRHRWDIPWARIDWTRVRWTDHDLAPDPPAGRSLTMHAWGEDVPGQRWACLHDATRAAYHAWYLAPGSGTRPTLEVARARLEEHMPELVPVWTRLVELTGDDEVSARLLTMWEVPPFVSGCSQAVLPGPEPILTRNYDYDPALFEGVVTSTNYSGRRRVTGTSDLLWGLLDGMNEDGLVVSLAWGGRPGAAAGFAIPLVLRYLLETCSTVSESVTTLRRVPVAQAYNLTLADTTGAHASVFVAPGEAPVASSLPATTNHRLGTVEHPEQAAPIRSRERQVVLTGALRSSGSPEELVRTFLTPPVRSDRWAAGFGTLYTACYEPAVGQVTYHWPGSTWQPAFDRDDDVHRVTLAAA